MLHDIFIYIYMCVCVWCWKVSFTWACLSVKTLCIYKCRSHSQKRHHIYIYIYILVVKSNRCEKHQVSIFERKWVWLSFWGSTEGQFHDWKMEARCWCHCAAGWKCEVCGAQGRDGGWSCTRSTSYPQRTYANAPVLHKWGGCKKTNNKTCVSMCVCAYLKV